MEKLKNSTQEIGYLGVTKLQGIKWAIALFLPLCVFLVPTSVTFTADMRLFFVITGIGILMMALDLIEMVVPALMLPVFYIVTGLASPAEVFNPWLGTNPWLNLFGLMFASILLSTGLLTRAAYFCIVKAGATYKGILYGLMVVGFLFALIIPSNALVPLATISFSICKALDLGKSKESAGIMLTGFFAAVVPGHLFYSFNFAMFEGPGMAVTDVSIPWLTYTFQNLMIIPYCFILVFIILKVIKPNMNIKNKSYFVEKCKELGQWSTGERKGAILAMVLLALLVTSSLHGVQPAWLFALLVTASFLPGITIGTKETLSTINYSFIFLIAGCMSIGEVSAVLGIGTWLADMILPLVSGSHLYVFLIAAWLLVVLLNFLLTPVAIASVVSVPLTQIAVELSLNPHIVYYVLMQASNQVVFPYEWPWAFLVFSFGLIPLKCFIKTFSVIMVFNFIYVMAVMVPYWYLIGLI